MGGERRSLSLGIDSSLAGFCVGWGPTAAWVIQQLREAFPYDAAPKYLICDRDTIFSPEVMRCIKAMSTTPRRISYRSPCQNSVAERWIGNCRRKLLEHVVVLGYRHLVRLCPFLHPLLHSHGPLPLGAGQGCSQWKAWYTMPLPHGESSRCPVLVDSTVVTSGAQPLEKIHHQLDWPYIDV